MCIRDRTVSISTKQDQSFESEQFNYDPVLGVYTISVASELISMHPNTLRKYDRNGLVKPSRTDGKRRLYSENDLLRLQIVKLLTEKYGLNLEGAKLVLALSMKIKEVVNLLEQVEDFGNSRLPEMTAVNIHDILDRAKRSAQLGFGAHIRLSLIHI